MVPSASCMFYAVSLRSREKISNESSADQDWSVPNRVLGKSEQTPHASLYMNHRPKQSRNFVFVVTLSQKNVPGLALYTYLHTTAQDVDQELRGANVFTAELEDGP